MATNPWIVVGVIYGLLLSLAGLYYLYKDKIQPWIKSKKGYIRVYKLMPNGRIRKFYAKPEFVEDEGYVIKDTGNTFIDLPSHTFYEGNIKCVLYDEEGNQVSIKEMNKIMPPLAPEMLDAITERVWNTAKIAAFKKADRLEMLLWAVIIAAGIAMIASAVTAFKVSDVYNQILLIKSQIGSIKAITQAASQMTPA